jgi:hypothetical protein
MNISNSAADLITPPAFSGIWLQLSSFGRFFTCVPRRVELDMPTTKLNKSK